VFVDNCIISVSDTMQGDKKKQPIYWETQSKRSKSSVMKGSRYPVNLIHGKESKLSVCRRLVERRDKIYSPYMLTKKQYQ